MAKTIDAEAAPAAKPYHHGDLQRALVEAAERILERDGPASLSLRAVAREAGVSPAAPYHHFKDKDELINAVARRGFEMLAEVMTRAVEGKESYRERTLAIGVAYVCFARDHRAIYHVMYDPSRKRDFRSPGLPRSQSSAYQLARELRVKQAEQTPGVSPIDVELATIAGWCAAHGLAEMCQAKEFDELKRHFGGDEPFFEAVLDHLGMLRGQ